MRARLHGHSFDAVLALVAAGVGIALVPSSVLGGRWQANPLAIIELDELWALRRLEPGGARMRACRASSRSS